MKLFRNWFAMLAVAMLTSIAACGGDDDKKNDDDDDGKTNVDNKGTPHAAPPGINEPEKVHAAAGDSWTFLVYMVADNDLEPFALLDVAEMAEAGSKPNFNIVVQIDRAEGFAENDVFGLGNFTNTKRLLINNGSVTQLEDMAELNHGLSSTLSDFIVWGAQEYPSDKLAVILWDHGSAWPGFGADFSHDYDALTMPEMATSLGSALTTLGRNSIDILGFDACLMGALESGLALRPFAEYLLASEELEPGHGWDYSVLAGLTGASTPTAMGQAIIDGFAAQAAAERTNDAITLSFVDLYNLKAIERALHDMDNALVNDNSVTSRVVRAREGALEFGRDPSGSASAYMIDLGNIANSISGSVPTLKAAADKLKSAIDDAVLVQTTGRTTRTATGISVYWPPYRRAYREAYNNIPGILAWRNFLETAQGVEHTGGDVVPTFTDDPVQVEKVDVTGGSVLGFGAQLVAGTEVNVVETGIYYGVIQGENYFLLGDSYGILQDGLVVGVWDGYALTITQGSTTAFGYLSYQEGGDGTTLAAIPFIYVRSGATEGSTAFYVATYDASNEVQQATLYQYSEAGFAELTPEAGSTLYPVQGLLGDDGIEYLAVESAPLDATLDIELGYEYLLGSDGWEGFTILYATGATGEGDAVASTERSWPVLQ